MQQPTAPKTTLKRRLFRVRFRDGATVTTTATNSLQAEQNARRLRAGFVETVRLVKGMR